MSRSGTAMVDVLLGSALTEKSSRLYNEKSPEKTSDLLSPSQCSGSQMLQPAISRRALTSSSAHKNPPSDTRPSTLTTSGCAGPPADGISESPSPIAADCEGYDTALGNTSAESDAVNGGNAVITSDHLHVSQHSGVGTSTPNPTPPSSLEVTGTDTEIGSSLSSARSSPGEGQHKNGVSTASRGVFANLPNDYFREAVQIPGCKPTTFVYPHSSSVIGAVFHERYLEVVNIFRHNAKEHPELRENLQYIDYTLKLCGTSSGDSRPSILVFCRHREFKALKGLLMSKELKYQYCLRRQSRKYPWSVNQTSTIEEDHRPFFNLYFWRECRPRTLYWGQESVRLHSQLNRPSQSLETHPHMVPGLTMCGSIVEILGSESIFSTLGCVIKIDSEFYAITSMHTFRLFEMREKLHSGEVSEYWSVNRSSAGAFADEAEELSVCDEQPLYGCDTDPSNEHYDYFIDDVEYESLAEDDEGALDPIDSHSTVANVYYGNQTQTSAQTREVKDMLALFPTPDELDSSGELDLDWALIKLMDQQDWRPNAFVYSNDSTSPVFLSKVVEFQPTQETLVFIITSESTPRRGMLQPGNSLLGGINGKTPSTMWTVVLHEHNSLKRGDSGSIVVDATTNTIYGHVIGSNPIGEVYISPYASILEQIQHRFPGSAVAIPEPMSTLACLIDFYAMSVRDKSGAESLAGLEEAYRKAALGPDEVEQISPHFLQHHFPDATVCATDDQESPSMLRSTATARSNKRASSLATSSATASPPSSRVISPRSKPKLTVPPGSPAKRPASNSEDEGSGQAPGKIKLPKLERGPEDLSSIVKNRLQSYTRTGQACDRCKVRKIRCDALPEGCSHCINQNLECYVTDRVTGRTERRGYLQELEREGNDMLSHIRNLEELLGRNGIEVKPYQLSGILTRLDEDGIGLLQGDGKDGKV